MAHQVLILDDESKRVERMIDALRRMDPGVNAVVWTTAIEMIGQCGPRLESASLISLDHDLYKPLADGSDPGDGLDVAEFLAGLRPACPIIVHSSNSDRARTMTVRLREAGWTCKRVMPFGDQWIEDDWALVAREVLSTG